MEGSVERLSASEVSRSTRPCPFATTSTTHINIWPTYLMVINAFWPHYAPINTRSTESFSKSSRLLLEIFTTAHFVYFRLIRPGV